MVMTGAVIIFLRQDLLISLVRLRWRVYWGLQVRSFPCASSITHANTPTWTIHVHRLQYGIHFYIFSSFSNLHFFLSLFSILGFLPTRSGKKGKENKSSEQRALRNEQHTHGERESGEKISNGIELYFTLRKLIGMVNIIAHVTRVTRSVPSF